jgi:hypothetical protein
VSATIKFRETKYLGKLGFKRNNILYNYYYVEILKKIIFTFWSSSLSHLMPDTQLVYKIFAFEFYYFNQTEDKVPLKAVEKNE